MKFTQIVVLAGTTFLAACVAETPDAGPNDAVEDAADALVNTSSDWADDELAKADGRLLDYSYAGYRHGESPIPTPAVAANVRRFGAVGDGRHDDTSAFITALERTDRGAILVPAGRYVITRRINIDKPNVVLRGEGPDRTILEFPKSLTEVDHVPPSSYASSTSPYAFKPGFINVNGRDTSVPLANVTAGARRGSKSLRVSTTAGMRAGQWVTLVATDVDNTLARRLYGDHSDPGSDLTGRKLVHFFSRIASIRPNEVTLERRLPIDFETRWKPALRTSTHAVKSVGIEGLTFHFKGSTYPGHFKEHGYNAMVFSDVVDCWVRDVKIINADLGILLVGTQSTTLADITFDTDFDRGGLVGHHALWVKEGGDNLITGFDIRKKFVHDLSTEGYEYQTVFSRGRGRDINMDHHRNAPYATLFSDIDLGQGSRAFESGGNGRRGAHSGALSTFWNIRSASRLSLPERSFGPLLNFVGVNTSATTTPDAGWHLERIAPSSLRPANLHEAQRANRVGR